jgi:hypothetical protein
MMGTTIMLVGTLAHTLGMEGILACDISLLFQQCT